MMKRTLSLSLGGAAFVASAAAVTNVTNRNSQQRSLTFMICIRLSVLLFRFRLRPRWDPVASRIRTLRCSFLLCGQVGFGLRRIVFRVARRHLRADFLSPLVQPFAEFFDLVRHLDS